MQVRPSGGAKASSDHTPKRKTPVSNEESPVHKRSRHKNASINALTKISTPSSSTRTELQAQQAMCSSSAATTPSHVAQQLQMPAAPASGPSPLFRRATPPCLRFPFNQHHWQEPTQLFQSNPSAGAMPWTAAPATAYAPQNVQTLFTEGAIMCHPRAQAYAAAPVEFLVPTEVCYPPHVAMATCATETTSPSAAIIEKRTVLKDTKVPDHYHGRYRLNDLQLWSIMQGKKTDTLHGKQVVKYVLETYFRNRHAKARNPELDIQVTRSSFEAVKGRGYEYKNGVISLVEGPLVSDHLPNIVQISCRTISRFVAELEKYHGWIDPL